MAKKTTETEDVRVCLNKRYAGPRGNFGPGQTLRVSPVEAKGLVAAGAAELVEQMIPYKAETADDKSAEKRETADKK